MTSPQTSYSAADGKKVRWLRHVLFTSRDRKSLDNNDRDQVEPAIRKTSCGLAHYYVPQYRAQKNRFATRLLQSCEVSQDSKRWVSVLNEKQGMFLLIHPWLCCYDSVIYICSEVYVFDKLRVNLVQVVVILTTTTCMTDIKAAILVQNHG